MKMDQTSPLYGLIFLFRYPTGKQEKSERQQQGQRQGPIYGEYDMEGAEQLFFAAQTIQNACGTQALLSILLNKDGDGAIDIGLNLREFKEFTTGFPPEVREHQYFHLPGNCSD